MHCGEGDQTCVSNVHLGRELLHQRKDAVTVVLQNRSDPRALDKSLECLYRGRVVFEQVTGFSDYGFAGKNFSGKARKRGTSPTMMAIVRVDSRDQRTCIKQYDAP